MPSSSPSSSHHHDHHHHHHRHQKKVNIRFSRLRRSAAAFFALLIFSPVRLLKPFFTGRLFPSFNSMDDLFAEDDFFSTTNDSLSDEVDSADLLLLGRSHSVADRDRAQREDRLYIVPYRWWIDATKENCFLDSDEAGPVLYTSVASKPSDRDSNWKDEIGSDMEIVFSLQTGGDEHHHDRFFLEETDKKEEACSSCEYALLSESLWFKALKWYNNCIIRNGNVGSSLSEEDTLPDIFSILVRISALQQASSFAVKICQMDNTFQNFRRACKLFGLPISEICIWDFSGQIAGLLKVDSSNGDACTTHDEVLLELQIYGVLDTDEDEEGCQASKKVDERSGSEELCDSSFKMNGDCGSGKTSLPTFVQPWGGQPKEASVLGLTGLSNLGNTCFMNSAIQCLVHTEKLVDYFLGSYKEEINYCNPLGMKGELALAFGDLLRRLWAPGRTPIAPRAFKSTLACFAPQFSGYNQHDSQEFLAFLLDGLHEDLNRVKNKPYTEAKDADGRPHEEVADEYWQNHLVRNDSIIVDLFQGQYRSTLACPMCKRVSVTFDPFMYLSLPLPSTTMRRMTLTLIGIDGKSPPSEVTVTVPQCGRTKDLIQALNTACSLENDESVLIAEVYNHCILRFLDDPSDSLALVRDDDFLVAYRLPKERENHQLVVFMHQHQERGMVTKSWKLFGTPMVTRMCNISSGSQIHEEFLKLIGPFSRPDEDDYQDTESLGNGCMNMEETNPQSSDESSSSDIEGEVALKLNSNFQFHVVDQRAVWKGSKIKMEKPYVYDTRKVLHVLVSWPQEMVRKYDTRRLSSLPEIFKPGFSSKRPHESVSLYRCLEGFLKEEPLGPVDMWYCPGCKKHRQANKKLDLWRLPKVLVIHLKRFSYSRVLKNKLETYVDFPIDKLDISAFITHKSSSVTSCYKLYAVSNHYGSMGGGHYTALVNYGNRWYEFDDCNVSSVSEAGVKTSAAYVLFYQSL